MDLRYGPEAASRSRHGRGAPPDRTAGEWRSPHRTDDAGAVPRPSPAGGIDRCAHAAGASRKARGGMPRGARGVRCGARGTSSGVRAAGS
jgi:hypothetical protein